MQRSGGHVPKCMLAMRCRMLGATISLAARSVCGRPFGCKRFFEGWCAGSGASVCPACWCGPSHAAGLYGVRGPGPLRFRALEALGPFDWFSRPRLTDRCAIPLV
jgi:hypothetical protein